MISPIYTHQVGNRIRAERPHNSGPFHLEKQGMRRARMRLFWSQTCFNCPLPKLHDILVWNGRFASGFKVVLVVVWFRNTTWGINILDSLTMNFEGGCFPSGIFCHCCTTNKCCCIFLRLVSQSVCFSWTWRDTWSKCFDARSLCFSMCIFTCCHESGDFKGPQLLGTKQMQSKRSIGFSSNAYWCIYKHKWCFSPQNCVGFLFLDLHPPGGSASVPPPRPPPRPPLCHTQLCHTQLWHTPLCHTQLCHTQLRHKLLVTYNFVTHNFVTYNFVTCNFVTHTTLSHTTLSHANCHTHNFVTYKLSHTTLSHTTLSHANCHTQLCHIQIVTHTQLCHIQLCHTQLVTHNFVTYKLSHTQVCRIQIVTHNFVTYNFVTYNFVTYKLSHTTCHTQLSHLRFAWQAWYLWHLAGSGDSLGRRLGPWRRGTFAWHVLRLVHPKLSHVAGVALGDIHLRFAWQAWYLWHLAGSGDALGGRLGPVAPRHFCVAGVALGDIRRRFTWQAWHLVTSTFVWAHLFFNPHSFFLNPILFFKTPTLSLWPPPLSFNPHGCNALTLPILPV